MEHLRVAGEVTYCAINTNRETKPPVRQAVVCFRTAEAAAHAIRTMRDYPLLGTVLDLRPAGDAASAPVAVLPEPDLTRTALFIRNLPKDTAWWDLKDFFRTVAAVRFCMTFNDRATGEPLGWAVARFASESAALTALRMLRRTPFQGVMLEAQFDTRGQWPQGGGETDGPAGGRRRPPRIAPNRDGPPHPP